MQVDPSWLLAGAGAGFLMGRVRCLAGWVERRVTFSVTLVGDAHFAVAARLAETLDDRMLLVGEGGVRSSREVDEPVPRSGRAPAEAPPARLAPGTRWARIEGRRVLIGTSREKPNVGTAYIEETVLTSLARNRDWLMGWIGESIRLWTSEMRRGLPVYSTSGYGWSRATVRPFRRMETIEHPDGAPARILEAVRLWQACRESVAARGENFHVGFLLHGPPGTGKTSTAIAIASELKRPLYVLTPGMMGDARSAEGPLRDVPAGCVLLVEEAEQIFGKGKGSKELAALAGALSQLDGPLSAQDVVRVFTTNYPDRLDERMFRAGRIDQVFEFPPRDVPAVMQPRG